MPDETLEERVDRLDRKINHTLTAIICVAIVVAAVLCYDVAKFMYFEHVTDVDSIISELHKQGHLVEECSEWVDVVETIETGEYEYELIYQIHHNFDLINNATVEIVVDPNIGHTICCHCSTSSYMDCGEYSCKEINLTTCNYYEELPVTEIVVVDRECVKLVYTLKIPMDEVDE